MSAISVEKLDRIIHRYATVEHGMSAGVSGEAFVKLSKEYADLEPTAKAAISLKKAYDERLGLDEMIKAGGEMAEMAQAERPELEARIAGMEHGIRILLLPKDAADERNVILEVRAGTGGDEAAIFAGDLFRMYQRYAASKGWKFEVVSTSDGEHGGYKEAIANIFGSGPYAHMKFEFGRAPGAAGSGHRNAGAHSHLRRHRGGAARGRRGGHQDRGQGSADRRLPLVGSGRAVGEYDRLGGAHHPSCRPASPWRSRRKNPSSRTRTRR